MPDQDIPKKDILMLDKEAQKGIADRLASLEKEDVEISLKKYIEKIYPQLAEAIEKKGYTRESLYDKILDDEQRAKISRKTFVGYYYAAKRKWLADEAARRKEEAKQKAAGKVVEKEKYDAEITSMKKVDASSNSRKTSKKNGKVDDNFIDEVLKNTVETEAYDKSRDIDFSK